MNINLIILKSTKFYKIDLKIIKNMIYNINK